MEKLRTQRAGDNAVDQTSGMASKSQQKAPEQTFQEVKYLRHLIDNAVPVRLRLSDNSEVTGLIEFYDANFIRITRKGEPNLFVFKHDIKYLYEA
jgi:host factor-I protein